MTAALAINTMTPSFKQHWDGLLGIAPLGNVVGMDYEKNYLWKLQKDGLIDHMTVSIYLREHTGNLSSIKFGSYDPSAIHPQSPLYLFRTVSQREWSLSVKDFQVNSGQILGATKELYFAYHLPYLYLPDAEFNEYVAQIKKWDSTIECRPDICWYKDHLCHQLDASHYFTLKFKIFDSTNRQFSLGIPVSHGFYINNSDLGVD